MKIFSDDFQKIKLDVILNGIEKDGFYFCKSAINSDLINQIEIDVSKNRFSINKNWISGVYTKMVRFLPHLRRCLGVNRWNYLEHVLIKAHCINQ